MCSAGPPPACRSFAEPQSRRAAEPQSRRAAEPQSRGGAGCGAGRHRCADRSRGPRGCRRGGAELTVSRVLHSGSRTQGARRVSVASPRTTSGPARAAQPRGLPPRPDRRGHPRSDRPRPVPPGHGEGDGARPVRRRAHARLTPVTGHASSAGHGLYVADRTVFTVVLHKGTPSSSRRPPPQWGAGSGGRPQESWTRHRGTGPRGGMRVMCQAASPAPGRAFSRCR